MNGLFSANERLNKLKIIKRFFLFFLDLLKKKMKFHPCLGAELINW